MPPGYRLRDYLLQEGSRWLSQIVGVRNITKPFWNRWRASLIGDETIMQFLGRIHNLEDWLPESVRLLDAEEARFQAELRYLSEAERINGLRRLSFLCHLGQWGSVTTDGMRQDLYRRSRDFYIEAETLAYGSRYRRVPVRWNNGEYWANIHRPDRGQGPYPGVIIVHGMDDTKEEHLATELAAVAAGVAVCSIDGPGQGEALILDGVPWPDDYADFLVAVVGQLQAEQDFDADRLGLAGISWGGFWIYKVAARLRTLRGLFDLGGSTHWKEWYRELPFFLKLRFCIVLNAHTDDDIARHEEAFSFQDELRQIRCPVRIVHGRRDPVVSLTDKERQTATLRSAGTEVTMRVFPKGDHCCTGEAPEVREDAAIFFTRSLLGV